LLILQQEIASAPDVEAHLGKEVSEKLNRIHKDNTITVIFTNIIKAISISL